MPKVPPDVRQLKTRLWALEPWRDDHHIGIDHRAHHCRIYLRLIPKVAQLGCEVVAVPHEVQNGNEAPSVFLGQLHPLDEASHWVFGQLLVALQQFLISHPRLLDSRVDDCPRHPNGNAAVVE